MTVRVSSVHGVAVRLDSDLPPPMAEDLLARFPAAPADGAVDLEVRLRLDPRAQERADPEGAALFFHGALRAFASAGAIELRWDGSVLRVASDGRRIDGHVHPQSAADPHAFANVPLLVALTLALRARGLFHVHAAAVVVPGLGGVLLAGGAGSGKSTLALALAAAGGEWLGDDAVLVARGGEGPTVHSFPKLFHVADPSVQAHPRLLPLLTPCGAPGKRALDPRVAFPGQERASFGAPACVLLPTITGASRTTVEPLPRAEALGALVESSALVVIEGMAGASAQLGLLGALANAPVCARALLGRDLLEDPRGCALALARELQSLAGRA